MLTPCKVFNNKITHYFLKNKPEISNLYSSVREFYACHVLLLLLTVKSHNGYSSKHFSWNHWWQIGHFNLQPHFSLFTFSYSKCRTSGAMLKIHTSSPRDHISFPNMTEYGRVLFYLTGNKNQQLYHPRLCLTEQIYVFARLLE